MRSDSNVDQEDLCSASRDCDVGLVSQLLANHPFDADGTTAALSEAELDPTIFADAAKTCLRFGADPAPALHEAIAQEEYRTSTIAENAAYLESRPEFSYKKSESTFEKEMVEERESQAMVALLRNAMG
jgi:hypothetical protein